MNKFQKMIDKLSLHLAEHKDEPFFGYKLVGKIRKLISKLEKSGLSGEVRDTFECYLQLGDIQVMLEHYQQELRSLEEYNLIPKPSKDLITKLDKYEGEIIKMTNTYYKKLNTQIAESYYKVK